MTHRFLFKKIVSVLVCSLLSPVALADLVVITSVKNTHLELSLYQVAEIFLGKSATFPGGVLALPLDQVEGTPARDEFYLRIVGKNAPQMTAYWSKMIFTGQGKPPAEIGDSLAIKRQIMANPHAIGYVDKNAVDSSVRVLLKLY